MSVNVYGIPIKYKDKLDLLKKVLRIYASVININAKKNYLRPRLVDVLAFYILFGYNKKTKELILQSLKMDIKNLNQINSELTKKKFLIRDSNNYTKKHISKELEELNNYFILEDTKKIFLIKFSTDD